MRCQNRSCRWNYDGYKCSFPYEITLNEVGKCNNFEQEYIVKPQGGLS